MKTLLRFDNSIGIRTTLVLVGKSYRVLRKIPNSWEFEGFHRGETIEFYRTKDRKKAFDYFFNLNFSWL